MKYIHRGVEASLLQAMNRFGAILLTGPRQAGKSTLLRHIAQKKWGTAWQEFSFDTPADIAQFQGDPNLFFLNHPGPLLLDEVQNVPDIFPWLKKMVDQAPEQTRFLLTGSQHFPMMKGVAESMAGRVLVAELQPFSQRELQNKGSDDIVTSLLDPKRLVKKIGRSFPCTDGNDVLPAMLAGGFPAQAIQKLGASWFSSYRSTYLQRDILALGRVENIGAFDRFLVLCAGLSGTLPNKANLADTLQVDAKTVDHWLSMLQAGYQITLIPAWVGNTVKRIAKRPKMIFTDSGLGLHLQAVRSNDALQNAPHFGNLLEAWILSEIQKAFLCCSNEFDAYHWRTSNGVECDLILHVNNTLVPIEIKHTAKPSDSDCKGLIAFRREHRNATIGLLFSMHPKIEWISTGILNVPIGFLFG